MSETEAAETSPPPAAPETDVASSPEPRGKFRNVGGSVHDEWNLLVARQVTDALWLSGLDEEARDSRTDGAVLALIALKPKDEIEGMLGAQMIATHNAAMEMHRRAWIQGQTSEATNEALNQANKLSRTYAALVETLNKHRGKGQQKVTVEHVHVYEGGQAVVGAVEMGGRGGGSRKTDKQPHARQLAYAPEPAMPSPNAGGHALPAGRDEEWALSDARGNSARGTAREHERLEARPSFERGHCRAAGAGGADPGSESAGRDAGE
jgi:hypothetical protein